MTPLETDPRSPAGPQVPGDAQASTPGQETGVLPGRPGHARHRALAVEARDHRQRAGESISHSMARGHAERIRSADAHPPSLLVLLWDVVLAAGDVYERDPERPLQAALDALAAATEDRG